MTDHSLRKIYDSLRQAAAPHERSGEYKQGDGDPSLRRHPGIKPLCKNLNGQVIYKKCQKTDNTNGKTNGNLCEHKEDENKKKNK